MVTFDRSGANSIELAIELACKRLRERDVVAIPTETVYGLAADATCDEAVQKIYSLKGRPSTNPLIVHVDSLEMALSWAVFDDRAFSIASYFWGIGKPLTLVLPKREGLSVYVTAGLETVAIRRPAHPVALDLIRHYKKPLAAPSANRSEHISPTTPEHVRKSLGGTFMILEGGSCSVGVESTILDLTNEAPRILRPGGCLKEDLLDFGLSLSDDMTHAPATPGRYLRHYAPRIPVHLNVLEPQEGAFFITLGVDGGHSLSLSGDLEEAARNLFPLLYEAESSGAQSIAVMPIPDHGLGRALRDRLEKASGA